MLEHVFQFNGLSLQDQSKRDFGLTMMAMSGLRTLEAYEGLRALGGPGAYEGPLVADSVSGVTHYEAAGVHVIAAGKFFNNARPGDGSPESVTAQSLSQFGSGGPEAVVDHQHAVDYAHALNSTVGITAADVGLDWGKQYLMVFAYTLGVATAKTPRIGWHNTTVTDSPGRVNTADALAVDAAYPIQVGGLHQACGDNSNSPTLCTPWPTALDNVYFRAFTVTTQVVGEFVALDQIYLIENVAAKSQWFFPGQAAPSPNLRSSVLKYVNNASDPLTFSWHNQYFEDGQITSSPEPSESDPLGTAGTGNLDYARTLTQVDDRNLLRSQFLVGCRTTDTADIFGRSRYGQISLAKNGGAAEQQANPLTMSWVLRFFPMTFLWQIDSPFTLTDQLEMFMYSESGAPVGTKVHTDFIAAVRPPLNPPDAITGTPGCGTTQGVGQADIDGLVHWNFQAEYEMLTDVRLQFFFPDFPFYTGGSFSDMSYLGAGLWETGDFSLDALTDVGSYTVEIRAVYYTSGLYPDDAPSDTISCQFHVGVADPPGTPTIDNCPSGPVSTGTYTFTWTDGFATGFTATDHYTYRIDGGSWVTTTLTSVTFTGLTSGSHTFEVEAWDAFGDHSAITSCTFVVDSTGVIGPAGTPRDGCGITDNDWGVLDGSGWWIRVKRVDGLWDADVRDERYPKPSQSGERSVNDFYGGKPITVTAEVRGQHLANLREGQRAVQLAFGDLGVHRFYFRSKIDDNYYFVCARKIQPIDFPEEQTDQSWKRPFTVALRGDDPRAYSLVLHHQVLTIGAVAAGSAGGHFREYDILSGDNLGGTENIHYRAYDQPTTPRTRIYGALGVGGGGGSSAIVTNAGTAETYPISVIHGPMSGGLTYANLTTGEQLVWLAGLSLGATDTLVVDHGYDEIYRNGQQILDYTAFDALHSEFWPLEPGDNEIAVLPYASGDGAYIDIYWRDALR